MTLAKAIGGVLPIGVMVAKGKFKDVLKPGTHASTFGGGPLVAQAALSVFEAIECHKLLKNAREKGKYLRARLLELKSEHSSIKEVRGIALTIGVELAVDGNDVYKKCFAKRLLINCTQGNVLRIMPPINVTKKEIDKAVKILDEVLNG